MWKHQGILPYCIRLCLWWNVGWDFRFWTSLVMGNQNAGTSCSPLVGNVYKTLAVQLLIVPNLGTPWTTACQVPLSFSICWVCSNSCPLSQWCHPNISSSAVPSPPDLSLSQHQDIFQWVSSSHQVAKVLEFQLQHHQSFQWTTMTDHPWSPYSPRDSQEFYPTPQFKSINSSVLSL